MPAVLSKITPRNVAVISCAGVFAGILWAFRQNSESKLKPVSSLANIVDKNAASKSGDKTKAHVDKKFFRKLFQILKIMVPSWLSPEMLYLVIVALALLSRTYADVWMIQNGTAIESAIISRDKTLVKIHLFRFIMAMPIISVVNNFLKYGLNELKLRFRTRLTNYLYSQYLNGFTFYKMSNLDNRIANADQLLTQDVEKFCESIVECYSNISKPILDIFLYVYRLTWAIGFQGPGYMLAYLALSGMFLMRLRRPVGKMTVVEQQLEGEFRFINSRLIVNSEEIAFYQGNNREQRTLTRSFDKLVRHLRKLVWFRFSMGFMDNIVAKYVATVVGYLVVSRPFLDLSSVQLAKHSQKELMQDYYKSGRMLVKLAEAIGRLALAGREMTRLAGFTARVTELMQVLQDLNKGHYVRTMLTEQSNRNSGVNLNNLSNGMKLIPGSGRIIAQDKIIRFENVPLVTPNGDVLIKNMNFEVRSGMNVLVCGPNGCGKSSLFRILGELWPLFGGTLTKPAKGKLFYIPQRPYMTLGTLRDQVIYPDNQEEMLRKGFRDRDLEKYLDLVQLTYILTREGGWDSVQDWMDVLSGGEKQRIAMARLFYHCPQFAILDECTSAVSVDVEGSMYQYCRGAGITLFTVSHRKSLWKHHEYYLHMDGRGQYDFKPIEESTQEFGS